MAKGNSCPRRPISPRLVWAFSLTALIGFWDAGYLTAKHFLGEPVNCSIFAGCEAVTTSRFAMIGPVPVALLGLVYYLFLLLLSLFYLETRRKGVFVLASRLTVIGLLASVWFLYLQVVVVKALCLYCLISVSASTILFVLGVLVWRSHWRQDHYGKIKQDE